MTAVVQAILSRLPWIDDLVLGFAATLATEHIIMTLNPNPSSQAGAVIVGGIVVVMHPVAQTWRGDAPRVALSWAMGMVGALGALAFMMFVGGP